MDRPVRKSPRLKYYDYSLCGAYSLTICTYHHQHLLGDIRFDDQGNSIILSEIGLIVKTILEEPTKFLSEFEILIYSIMPNHLHILVEKSYYKSDRDRTVSDFVCAFKSLATREVRLRFPDKQVWMKSFHDHIIKNDTDLNNHWDYIEQNVNNWHKDEYY